MKRQTTYSLLLCLSTIGLATDTQALPKLSKTTPFRGFPLAFEVNQGQSDSQTRFLAKGKNYTLHLTGSEVRFAITSLKPSSSEGKPPQKQIHTVQMQAIGSNPKPKVQGEAKLPGVAHYFLGKNPKKWHTHIPTYRRVRYKNVYRGVDQLFYGSQQQLEYDFVVAPFANYRQIALEFKGASKVRLDAKGRLAVSSGSTHLLWGKPQIYQEGKRGRKAIAGKYTLDKRNRVGFEIAQYDHSKPLVIDPVLLGVMLIGPPPSGVQPEFAVFMGGDDGDVGFAIAADANGNSYVARRTHLDGYSFQEPALGYLDSDVYVQKLNAAGDTILYTTHLGGTGTEEARGVAVDASGNAYLTGFTDSTDFPTQDPLYPANAGSRDSFVTKLSSDGTIDFCTYFGGSDDEEASELQLDSSGNIYIVGYTSSTDYPTTTGALTRTNEGTNDAFVAKFAGDGSAIAYSALIGGADEDAGVGLAVDSSGNAYISGETRSSDFPVTIGAYDTTYNTSTDYDAFVAKLNADGTALLYATYLGGEGAEHSYRLAVDASGNAYVSGFTASDDFPTSRGAAQTARGGDWDGFVSKLNPTGNTLLFSTYLGGSSEDKCYGILVDSAGNAYVTGYSASANFPITNDATHQSHNGGADAFLVQIQAKGGVILFSSFFGGSNNDIGYDIAFGSGYSLFLTGVSDSGDFPATTSGTVSGDEGYVLKLPLARVPYLRVSSVNAHYGAKAFLQAQLLRPYDASPLSNKTISISVAGTPVYSGQTDANGYVGYWYDSSSLALGTIVTYQASFEGDANLEQQVSEGKFKVIIANSRLTIDENVRKKVYRLGAVMSPPLKVKLDRVIDSSPIVGESITFSLKGTNIGTATTDSNGDAVLPYTPPVSLGAGFSTLEVSYSGSAHYVARTRAVNLKFSKTPTAIVLPAVSGNKNTSVNLVATLTNKDTSAALSGQAVKFFVGGSLVGQATTNASGVATLSYLLGGTAQKQSLSATFDGDDTFAAASKSNNITTK